MNTFAERFEVLARQHGSKPAITGVAGETLSYAALWQGSQRVAAFLAEREMRGGEILVTVMPTGAMAAGGLTALMASCACAPLSPACREEEIERLMDTILPRLIVVDDNIDSPVRDVANKRGIMVTEPPYDQIWGKHSSEYGAGDTVRGNLLNRKPDDSALVLSTSGTTSRPKIVALRHRNLCACADFFSQAYALQTEDRSFSCMPLYHIHGLMAGVFASVLNGACSAYAPRYDAEHYIDWMTSIRPTWLTGVPTFYQALLADLERRPAVAIPDSLRFIRSASSSLPPAVMTRLEERFRVPVLESYAMTEAAAHICVNPMPPRRRKPGSVGLPAGPEIRVLNDKAQSCAPGERGEITIKGPNVIEEYLESDGKREDLFVDEWLRTGDQGFFDEDGYLHVTGRIKELIIRGGHNISPTEIEHALTEHPDVIEAAAFGVEHPTLGQDAVSVVILRNDCGLSEGDLREFASEKLADYKMPSRIVPVNEIPKSGSGKVERRMLPIQMKDKLDGGSTAPDGELEEELASIWKEVLKVETVFREDGFFSLGGDSLLAEQVAVRIQDAMEIDLYGTDVMAAMTFSRLVEKVLSKMAARIDLDELSEYLDSLEKS